MQQPEGIFLVQLRFPVLAVVLAQQELGRSVAMQLEAAPARLRGAQFLQREVRAQRGQWAGMHREVPQQGSVGAAEGAGSSDRSSRQVSSGAPSRQKSRSSRLPGLRDATGAGSAAAASS